MTASPLGVDSLGAVAPIGALDWSRRPVFEPSDDVLILAERFQLGIPLHGLDGRPIPLRDEQGRAFGPVEAALLLLESSLGGLDEDVAEAYRSTAIGRAILIEDEGLADGLRGIDLDRRISGVFVSAAVRADMIRRHGEVSPSDLNHATLEWYRVHQVRRATLLAGSTWTTLTA
jgi:hypothetical protein